MLKSDWVRGGVPAAAFGQQQQQQQVRARKNAGESRMVVVRCGMLGKPAPFGLKSLYKDSRFDLFCINHLANSMSKTTGLTTRLKGYDALIDISRQLASSKAPKNQRAIVSKVLSVALPLWIPHMLRFFLQPSKFTSEFYAITTPLLFEWLVGPTEIKETEVNGVMQKSVVHIKKCRYLESSNCVGMCVNLCKIPSEDFIKKEFGVDVSMVPNFEDMSCDMIYGQKPSSLEHDLAMSQPCYKALCMNAQGKDRDCPKVPQQSFTTIKDGAMSRTTI